MGDGCRGKSGQKVAGWLSWKMRVVANGMRSSEEEDWARRPFIYRNYPPLPVINIPSFSPSTANPDHPHHHQHFHTIITDHPFPPPTTKSGFSAPSPTFCLRHFPPHQHLIIDIARQATVSLRKGECTWKFRLPSRVVSVSF